MKSLYAAILLGLSFGALNQAIAAHGETPNGFVDKSGDHASHVIVHQHSHPEVRNAPGLLEPFQDRGEDFAATVEVHRHAHPEVRNVPSEPESYINK